MKLTTQTKVKRHTLDFENEYNYDIIGINSYYPDFRLAWSLNHSFSFFLEKSNELFSVTDKKGESKNFPYYFSNDEENRLDVYLIKNKYQDKILIPEKKQIDYFLFLCNNLVFSVNDVVNQLRTIDCVMLAMSFKTNEIESTKQIIF